MLALKFCINSMPYLTDIYNCYLHQLSRYLQHRSYLQNIWIYDINMSPEISRQEKRAWSQLGLFWNDSFVAWMLTQSGYDCTRWRFQLFPSSVGVWTPNCPWEGIGFPAHRRVWLEDIGRLELHPQKLRPSLKGVTFFETVFWGPPCRGINPIRLMQHKPLILLLTSAHPPKKIILPLRSGIIWSNYSDLTRPHPKWWFSKGNPMKSPYFREI